MQVMSVNHLKSVCLARKSLLRNLALCAYGVQGVEAAIGATVKYKMWKIRHSEDTDDVDDLYVGNKNLFYIQLHHGGYFVESPTRSYVNGKVTFIDTVDIDEFSIVELNHILKEVGYNDQVPVFYHFRLPLVEMSSGLVPLMCDADVNIFRRYVKLCWDHEIFCEHGHSILPTYGKPPLADFMIEPVLPLSPKYVRKRLSRTSDLQCPRKLLFDLNINASESISNNGSSNNIEVQSKVDRISTIGESSVCVAQPMSDSQPIQGCMDIIPIESAPPATTQIDSSVVDWDDSLFDEPLPALGYEGNIEQDYQVLEDDEIGVNYGFGVPHEENVENTVMVADEGDETDADGSSDNEFPLLPTELLNRNDVDVDMDAFQGCLDPLPDGLPYNKSDDHNMAVDIIDNNSFEIESRHGSCREEILRNLGRYPKCSQGQSHEADFRLGERFDNKLLVKESLSNLAVFSRRQLYLQKNDRYRLRAKCRGPVPVGGVQAVTQEAQMRGNFVISDEKCPWVLLISKAKADEDWLVKTYNDTHTCIQTHKVGQCTQTYLSKKIYQQLEANPKMPVAALHKELERKFKLQLSFMKVFRARVLALNHIRGDFERQYTLLREYVLELQARNAGTTVKIGVESEPNFSVPTRVFKRIYICLGPLKEGFKYGQLEILGLDGAFMKGPYPGQVLSAVGLDGNNGIYPLAYAIVEAETKSSWTWFLECLGDDLDMGNNTNFTFISDRQKGLVPALAKVFPSAEHRFCVRHILDNMKLYWKGKPLKEHLWKCARAETIPEFNRAMAEFQKYNKQAYNWLQCIPAKHWSRSHFTGRVHSDVLLNNLCEVFNAKIVDGRDRPIISALEFIREYLMKKIVTV